MPGSQDRPQECSRRTQPRRDPVRKNIGAAPWSFDDARWHPQKCNVHVSMRGLLGVNSSAPPKQGGGSNKRTVGWWCGVHPPFGQSGRCVLLSHGTTEEACVDTHMVLKLPVRIQQRAAAFTQCAYAGQRGTWRTLSTVECKIRRGVQDGDLHSTSRERISSTTRLGRVRPAGRGATPGLKRPRRL